MPETQPSKKRWYDQQQAVSKSVSLMESFPSEFQIILGESVIELAEEQCHVKAIMTELRSLGPEKVLNIFKSKSKRRTSDAHQEIHQAMNYMYILPDGDRIFIANHIIALVGYFFEYFKLCKEEGVQPSANIARQVSKAYLQGDLNDPNIFLTIVRKQIQLSTHYSFQSNLNPSGQALEPVALYDEKVDASKQGMKIRQDKLE